LCISNAQVEWQVTKSKKAKKEDAFEQVYNIETESGTVEVVIEQKKFKIWHKLYVRKTFGNEETEIELEHRHRGVFIKGLVFKQRVIHIFYSAFDKKEDLNILYHRTFDPETIEFSAEMMVMKGSKHYPDKGGLFKIYTNNTSKNILIQSIHPFKNTYSVFGSNDFSTHQFILFDNDIRELMRIEKQFSKAEELFEIQNLILMDDGSFYILGNKYYSRTFFSTGQMIKNKKPNYEINLYYFQRDGKEYTYTVKSENSFLKGPFIKLFDNTIYLACLNSTISNFFRSGAGDLFLFTLNSSDLTEINSLTYDLRTNIAELFTRKETGKKTDELPDLKIKNILMDQKEGIKIIAEQGSSFVSSFTVDTGNYLVTSYNDVYYSGDILLLDVRNEHISWVRKISKRQETSNDLGRRNGYFVWQHENDIYFIFNDVKENENSISSTDTDVFPRKKDNIGVGVKVNDKGEMTKSVISRFEELEIDIIPGECSLKVGEPEIFLYGQGKKRFAKGSYRYLE
jgi:hypothetical protein